MIRPALLSEPDERPVSGFTAHGGQVYASGSMLSDHRVEDLLTFFEREADKAERAAKDARKAHCDLWDARCSAVDQRQNRKVA